MKLAERISSLVILGICVLFFSLSSNFSRFGALFPRVIIGILAALSLTLFIMTFVKRGTEVPIEKSQSFKSIYTLALMVGWAFIVDVVGFGVTSVVFFTVITIMLDKNARSGVALVKRIGLVVVVVGVFYVFFALLLFVPFPRGILF